VSPSELLASPSELLASPSELLASPSELLASPSVLVPSPSELSASPSELFASLSELLASPSELSASPSELLASLTCAGDAAQSEENYVSSEQFAKGARQSVNQIVNNELNLLQVRVDTIVIEGVWKAATSKEDPTQQQDWILNVCRGRAGKLLTSKWS
jgi:hypothetical protein